MPKKAIEEHDAHTAFYYDQIMRKLDACHKMMERILLAINEQPDRRKKLRRIDDAER